MKKVLAILLAGMMTATAFAGCGGGDTKSSGAGGESKAADGSKADASAAATIDPSWPDAKLFGDETDIVLKVWAPDAAVPLVTKQVEAFKSHYADVKFKKIEVVAQGESEKSKLLRRANPTRLPRSSTTPTRRPTCSASPATSSTS